jgi:transposase-like protein
MSTGIRYSDEFKSDAIKLARQEGKSANSVAISLGISPQTLRNWLKGNEDKQNPEKSKVAELEKKLKESERKIADLEMTNEILKKAAAIFVKDIRK